MAGDEKIVSSSFCLPVQTGVGSDLLMANARILPSHSLVLRRSRSPILSRLDVLLEKTQVHLAQDVADKLLRYIRTELSMLLVLLFLASLTLFA